MNIKKEDMDNNTHEVVSVDVENKVVTIQPTEETAFQQEKEVSSEVVESLPSLSEENRKQAAPEDVATYDFQQLLPKYKHAIKYLGKNSAQRVLSALIEYPLETQNPPLIGADEKTAFYYGVQLLDVRHVIWNALLKMQNEKSAVAEKEETNE